MEREIKITFPEARMEALEFFLKQKNEKIEDILTDYINKTYEKAVPQPVRAFTESRMENAEATGEPVEERQPQARGTNRRRNRQEAHSDTPAPAENTVNEAEENPVMEPADETENSMAMGM